MALMSILMMAAFSLLGVAVKNLWTLLVNRVTGNKDPDQQKLVRVRAWTALAAIGGAGLILVWFLMNGLLSLTAAFLDRRMALYIGIGLLIVGLQVVRPRPRAARSAWPSPRSARSSSPTASATSADPLGSAFLIDAEARPV
jgi:hypothetical protein